MSARRYSETDREEGLHAIALHGGSYKKAAKYLEDQGNPISENTLKGFRRNHPERYYEITKNVAPLIREKLAAKAESAAIELGDLEIKAMKKLEESLKSMEPQHVSQAMKNIITSKAIQIDKANVLRGMPSEIKEHRNPDDIFKAIGHKLGMTIEGSAEEIKPKEIEDNNES